MRKVINATILAVVLICLDGCKQRLKSDDFVQYIHSEDKGLRKVKAIGGFEYNIQYRPYDYIMLMECKGDWTHYEKEKRGAELKGTSWFSLSIKRSDNEISPLRYGISSLEDYNSRLNYFLNEAERDIWLVYDGKTIQPASYFFENNYNLTAQETIVVGFFLPEGELKPVKSMQLCYNDRTFNTGIIKSNFSEEALKNIPNLIIN